MGTISRADWCARTDWALVNRRVHGRSAYNCARQCLARQRRRQVYHLWYLWREKFGLHHGLQAQIADHIGVSRATISRDFAALSLREPAPVLELTGYLGARGV
jgi:hypothetical protein